MTDHAMPPEPDGDVGLSEDVYEHTIVEAFRKAPAAFAVMVDDELGAIWIGARGRTLRPNEDVHDAILVAALNLVRTFLIQTGGQDRGNTYRPGDRE